jgi:hypothetical protein
MALTAVIAVILLLTYGGSRATGPITRALTSLGATISRTESRVVHRVRGAGRADSLAWLEPYRNSADQVRTPARVLIGAYDGTMPGSFEGVVALEHALGTRLALLHFYSAWGDKPEQQFPLREVQAIADLGSIAVITWEPWLTDFDSRLHPHLQLRAERDRGGMSDIARGDYDFYIDRWAADAKQFGKPVFLRFGHEMNDPYRYPWGPQNNSAADYVGAWRRVVARFRAAGATNVVWVWAPHVAYAGFNDFYPGDEWVNWVGTGVLNFGTVARWSQWWSFHEIFGQKYSALAQHAKPIMIAELGSLSVGGSRREWFEKAFTDIATRHPLVKAVVFFNGSNDVTVTYQALDWTFAQDSAVLRTVSTALKKWQPED